MDIAEARAILRDANFKDYPTPWIFATAALIRQYPDDPYADSVGFKNWMDEQFIDDGYYSQWEVVIYGIMCEACRFTAEQNGWTPPPESGKD